MRHLPALVLVLMLFACNHEDVGTEKTNHNELVTAWRLIIHLPDVELPVQLQLGVDGQNAWLMNGQEKIDVPEVSRQGNLWRLFFPAFNNTLLLQQDGDRLQGSLSLVKRGYEQLMQVTGELETGYRFVPQPQAESEFTGRWQVKFVDDEGNESDAIGEFDQQGSKLVGTFLTPLGDYRYLAGEVDGDGLYLSTFDGAHAFVFTARMTTPNTLRGDFWSGTRWHESWTARKDFDAQLPDAYSLTYLKDGYDGIDFTFPDLDGGPVSLVDEKYRGKVVLVTLAGTWCPNCADETEFLSRYYRENHTRGLEIITLLYEHVEDFEAAARQGKALRSKHDIDFDLLIAGTSDKALAAQTLPMLNAVLAFPTLIFVDRRGDVRKIHTGFSGPATGEHYRQFTTEFNNLMDELLAETFPDP